MSFYLPNLPYAADALEPFMSARTIELHHDKHHRAYVTKLVELTADTPLADMPLEDVVKEAFGKSDKASIFNNAAQHWNHSFFWTCMEPGSGPIPDVLHRTLCQSFGDVETFKQKFIFEGLTQFGSGWVWLVGDHQRVEILKTSNANNPLVLGKRPLLVCDVWEHAYYIDYENRRAEYLKQFIEGVVNWQAVSQRLISPPQLIHQ
jgi:Fe-Mn family superoxide dismutase